GCAGAAGGVVVFELQVVRPAGFEFGLGGVLAAGLVVPAVDEEVSVEPEAHAVVGVGDEAVGLGGGRAEAAGPADGELAACGGQGRVGRALAPVMGDLRVGAGQQEL